MIGSNFAGIYNAQQAALEEELKRERGAERRLAHSFSGGSGPSAPVNSPSGGAPSGGAAGLDADGVGPDGAGPGRCCPPRHDTHV